MKLYAFIFLFFALLLRVFAGLAHASSYRDDVRKLVNATVFDEMFKFRKDPKCSSQDFYTYDAFLAAARYFGRFGFGTTGGVNTRKRELAAFLAQTSHQTTGGWPDVIVPDSPQSWGYCHVKEVTQDSYCKPDKKWPCAAGKKYYGRGPMQLQYNYNYGQAGEALGLNLLKNPDLVATDSILSFKTAIWFWMTSQGSKPSCHDVIIGKWKPSEADKAARRVPGFGVTTNIIAGGSECGHDADTAVLDRFEFYEKYCKMLDVNPGKHLECYSQSPFP